MKQKILQALIAKYKDMGFSDEALDAMAEQLSGSVTEDAGIDAAVTGVEPLLKIVQGEVDRRVVKALPPKPAPPKPAQKEGGDKPAGGAGQNEPNGDEAPSWFKTFADDVNKRLGTIELGKSTDTRKAQLEEALANTTDKFKEITLKAFGRMKFDKDEDFMGFLEDVKTDAKDFIQEEANNSLRGSHKPAAAGGDTTKLASKEETKSLAKSIVKL